MKRMHLMLGSTLIAIAATCAAERISDPKPVSLNENLLRIQEEKPMGFPKSYIERQGTYCVAVDEDWIKDRYLNKWTMWRNVQKRQTIDCRSAD